MSVADTSVCKPPAGKPRGVGLRFSLSTLMFVMLAVAMYFGGRASVTIALRGCR